MQPAIFLDRDGVIIENRTGYVRSWLQVSIYPWALPALARARESAFKFFIVTNQAAVGKGLVKLGVAQRINSHLVDRIERAGGRVDAVLMCPHTSEDGCSCRKPNPGLIVSAARMFSIDLGRSIMVGDAVSDLLAGQAAGIGTLALVRTGRGENQERLPDTSKVKPYLTYQDLGEALANLA